MNFYFEVGDIVFKRDTVIPFVLIKGFDPIPSGFRVWWADPLVQGKPVPAKRVRMYSPDMVRVRRPKEEERLRLRAEQWAQRRVIAQYTRLAREELKRRASLKKRGVTFNELPFNIPKGKWLSPEGVRQVLTDMGFKPETVDKRVRIMERLFGK